MSLGPAMRIDDLRQALNRILDQVVTKHGAEVEFAGDSYWTVPTDAAFDLTREPPAFTVGQLDDDTQSVIELLAQPSNEPVSIWHELAHIAGVLRGIEQLDRGAI